MTKVLITFEVPAEEAGPLIIHAITIHKAGMKDFAVPMPAQEPTNNDLVARRKPRFTAKPKIKAPSKSKGRGHGRPTAESVIWPQFESGRPIAMKTLKKLVLQHKFNDASAYFAVGKLVKLGKVQKVGQGLFQKVSPKPKPNKEIQI